MAPASQREDEQLMFKPKTPHFFKIILEETLSQGRLRIPKKFVRNLGQDLPNPMTLKVPNGKEWKVELDKSDGETWLRNGWREFADYYCLTHGSFVVFEYQGKCDFLVIVFDNSASEIDYPFNVEEKPDLEGKFEEPKKKETEDDDSVSVEILNDLPKCRKTRDMSPLLCSQASKKIKTSSTSENEYSNSKLNSLISNDDTESTGMKVEISTSNVNHNHPARQFEVKRGHNDICSQKHMVNRLSGRIKSLKTDDKKITMDRASSYKSENPFFIKAMQPSYVLPGAKVPTLCIPLMFAKRYFKGEQGEVMLQNSDGRDWTVDYRIYETNRSAYFLGNWFAFAQGNNLKVGDSCVFELIKRTDLTLKVTIYREDNQPLSGTVTSDDAELLKPKLEETDYDFCTEIFDGMSPTKKKRQKSPLLCPRPHKKMKSSTSKAQRTSVFPAYGNTNSTQSGGAKLENSHLSIQESGGKLEQKSAGREAKRPSCSRTSTALESAKKFISNSNSPSFKVEMQSCHLRKAYLLAPSLFVQ